MAKGDGSTEPPVGLSDRVGDGALLPSFAERADTERAQ